MIPAELSGPLVALVAGLLMSLVATPLVRLLALRHGFVNRPAEDRWADRPIALLGGVGIVLSTVSAASIVLLSSSAPGEMAADLAADGVAVGIVVSAALMFGVGLLDDIFDLTPHLKFIAQVMGGAVLVMFGGLIPLTAWYPVNALVSVFWFVAITNAVNLLDNMDGVAAGVAGIAAFFLGVSSLTHGSWLAASLAWALTGACVGFLRYNFKPASIFMGDAGSLFIGAVLAGLATAVNGTTTPGSVVFVLFVPIMIVAVPILDTALVTITRAVAGRAFYQGGRDHTTHRLVSLGLTERQTALLLYAFALAGGLLSLWLSRLNGIAGLVVSGTFLTALALLAAYLGHLRVEYTNEPRGSRAVTVLVTSLLYKRRLAEIVLDTVLCGLALISAVLLRFDGAPPPAYAEALGRTLPVGIGIQVLALALSGVYRGAWRYAGLREIHRVLAALFVGSLVLFAYVIWRAPLFAASPGILYTNFLCAAALLLSARLSFRSLHAFRRTLALPGRPVIVYGAGDAGEMALREMLNNRALGLTPVCLLDDDPLKHGARIHGIPVVGGGDRTPWALSKYGAQSIVIASTKLRPEVRQDLRDAASRSNVALLELDLRFRALEGEARVIALERRTPQRAGVPQEQPLATAVGNPDS